MPLAPGTVLNHRYRITALLGRGGFGSVYKAWDLNFQLDCAIKENDLPGPEAGRQFLREAQILRRLRHPNLPLVTDTFLLPGQGQYLVMDYVEGQDLQEKLDRLQAGGGLPPQQVVSWALQICAALEYLHGQNSPVIHRDIKPANIRITPAGAPILVDFGIAKFYDPQLSTTTGARAFTPGFSPPEQYGQGATGPRSDLYALGATLYALLTGQVPVESIFRLMGRPLPAPATLSQAVPPHLDQAIQTAMHLDPARRFAGAAEMKAALQAPAAGAPGRGLPARPAAGGRPFAAAGLHRVTEEFRFGRGCLNDLCFTRDGRELVAAAATGFYRYDCRAWAELPLVPAPRAPVSLKISPDGKWAAAVLSDYSLHTWRLPAWQPALQLSAPYEVGIAFSPDGGTLAAISTSHGQVRLWRSGDWQLLRSFTAPLSAGIQANVSLGLAFSPDGQYLAAGWFDHTVRVWRVRDGSLALTLSGHSFRVEALSFSPDGRLLASGGSELRVWDALSGGLLWSPQEVTGKVTGLVFSPDGRRLVTGSYNQKIIFWDARSGAVLRTAAGDYREITAVDYAPGGDILAAGVKGGPAYLFRPSDEALIKTLEGYTPQVFSAAFCAGEPAVAVVSFACRALSRWSLMDGRPLPGRPVSAAPVFPVALSPGAGYLASNHRDATFSLVRTDGPDPVRLQDAPQTLIWGAFSADERLFAARGSDHRLRVWEIPGGRLVCAPDTPPTNYREAIVFSPDGSLVALGRHDGPLELLRITDGGLQASLPSEFWAFALAYSPDGQWLASGGLDGAIDLWNPAWRTHARRLAVQAQVTALAFSPDSSLLAAANREGCLYLFRVHDGSLIVQQQAHTAYITALAFSPGGQFLLSGCEDGIVRVWAGA